MSVIIGLSDGTVVARGRNLRVLRDAVGKHPVEHITISREPDGGGLLHVLFSVTHPLLVQLVCAAFVVRRGQQPRGPNTVMHGWTDRFSGAACSVKFASYGVLCDFVRRWRSVQHVPLTMPDRDYDTVANAREALLLEG